MDFMTLKIIAHFLILLILLIFLFFFYFLPILIEESWHSKIFVFKKNSIEQLLKGKICLYGFDSVFSQVLIELSFVVCSSCSFCNRIKN